VEITLENGNLLSLQSNSEILLKRIRHDPETGEYENSFESDRGKIKAIVERLGKNSTFRVKTPSAVCGVRGTVMYLDISQGWTQAWYEGGQGDMTNTFSGDMVVLDPGQNSTSSSNGDLSNPAFTTTQQRITLEEFWAKGSPSNSPCFLGLENMGESLPARNALQRKAGGPEIVLTKSLAGLPRSKLVLPISLRGGIVRV